MLLGCVPNATTYYYPSMDGGQVRSRHCVPSDSILEFGALPLQASVIEANNGWLILLTLPAQRPPQRTWQTFRFTTADFHVRDLDSGIAIHRLPTRVLRDDGSESIMQSYSPARPGRWLYAIDVKLPAPPPARFP